MIPIQTFTDILPPGRVRRPARTAGSASLAPICNRCLLWADLRSVPKKRVSQSQQLIANSQQLTNHKSQITNPQIMPKKTITPPKPNPPKQQIIPRADQKPRKPRKSQHFKSGAELSGGVK